MAFRTNSVKFLRKKRELKTTHNAFQDCRVQFFLTTFLEIAVFSSSQCPLLPASQHFHQDEGRNKDRAKRAKKSYALRNSNFNEESRQMGRPQIDSDFVFY